MKTKSKSKDAGVAFLCSSQNKAPSATTTPTRRKRNKKRKKKKGLTTIHNHNQRGTSEGVCTREGDVGRPCHIKQIEAIKAIGVPPTSM